MARTLYLEDGSTEYIFAGETEQDELQKIIREHLGRDCEELYEEIIAELGGEDEDDYEKIADGYLSLLRDTLDELAPVIDMCNKPRMDKAKAHRHLKAIWDNIFKNI